MILGIPSWLVIAGKKVRFPPSAKERSPSSTTVVNMVRSEGLLGAGRECLWKHWLVMRRSLAAGAKAADMAYFLMFAPGVTPLSGMVAAIGSRWTVEQCFEEAKGEVDLDQYEVRFFHGWYRHITLCMLAHGFLVVLRTQS